MRAEIISVGTELLLGDILNTNAQFLARELASLGYTVYYQSVVGDNALRLRSLIAEAKQRSDVLVITGGLGPTEDDLTKETVADAFGDSLVLDEEELARLQNYFDKLGRTMAPNNRKQAMVPKNGKKLLNLNGTAPGAFFRQGNRYAFLLPGPPREMEPMFNEQVRPVLESMQDGALRSLTLRTFGIGESDLEYKVATLLDGSNPTAALYAKPGEVHIRITAMAGTGEHAEAMCHEYADLFKKILGDSIYSENGDDLETTVVRHLVETGQMVATAESCTGGLLSERITSVPGASGVFGFGATTYANDVKHQALGVRLASLRRWGAVSSQVAAEMAFGAARKGAADFGVGITGIAGPDGGTAEKPVGLVYVALAHAGNVYVRKLNIAGRSRDVVRLMATQNALDMLRRAILALPVPGAKAFAKSQVADVEREGRPRRRGGMAWRILVAFLLAAFLIFGALGLMYWNGRGQGPAGAALPSAQRLTYGSAEYTRAACEYVAAARAQNPAVTGMVVLPGAELEQLVASSRAGQQNLGPVEGQAGLEDLAAISASASPGQKAANTLVLGGDTLAPLDQLALLDDVSSLGTFTYYTERDAKVYEVLSVYLLDGAETQPDGFDPRVVNLAGYRDYLTYLLGINARNLYEHKTRAAQTDSFMTLCATGDEQTSSRVYVCGRLVGAESAGLQAGVSAAPSPLMPASYYTQTHKRPPDTTRLMAGWLRWYLDAETANSAIQITAGMPKDDKVPTITVQTAPLAEQDASANGASQAETQDDGQSVSTSQEITARLVFGEAPGEAQSEAASGSGSGSGGNSSSESGEDAATAPASESTSESVSQGAASNSASTPPAPTVTVQRPNPRMLTVTMNGVPMEDTAANVLAMICQREAGTAPPEAIKAQAIAAHSWILNQQGAGVEAPAVVGDTPTEAVRKAVDEVASQVLSGDGEAPAFTPWFQMAAHATNVPTALWGESRSYLISVSSPQDQGEVGWREIKTLPTEQLAALVLQNTGIDLAANPDPALWFSKIQRIEGGYVESLQVGGVDMTGLAFWRRALSQNGRPVLASPAFDISYNGNEFVFTTYGVGHGCGMSQAGAAAMAQNGKNHADILAHYYPGARLIRWE